MQGTSMSTDTIDPVAQPSTYQTMLLAALGDDDPAEVQAQTPAALRRLVAEAGPDLRTRPDPHEWSVLELIGHIADAELVVGGRYRWILAHDRPVIAPYDQDLWATRLRHNEADPEELVGPFEALRMANLALWRRTPAEERARYGIHQERGPESYDLTFRMLAGHDRIHTQQARDTLETVRSRAGHVTTHRHPQESR
jgi:hypothetical protein